VEPPTKRARVDGGMKAPSPDPHLTRTPGQLEKFPESFIEEMDDILIQPEWFNAWEGYFKEELPVGTEYERLIRTTMAELKDRVVPRLIGQWLFVLGNACKQARLKHMKDWPEFVRAYHVLIAKLILSDAYALFTHHEKEDRIFLEGLALWAGHDYSSAKGQDIAYWAEEYRGSFCGRGPQQTSRPITSGPTGSGWSCRGRARSGSWRRQWSIRPNAWEKGSLSMFPSSSSPRSSREGVRTG
jgi:hypothetical protein